MLQPNYRFTLTYPITVEQSLESSTGQASNIWSSGGSPKSMRRHIASYKAFHFNAIIQ